MQQTNDPYGKVLYEAFEYAKEYLRTVRKRHAGVRQSALDRLPELGGSLPFFGENPISVIRLLNEVGAQTTTATAGSRFFGGVIGGALPITVGVQFMLAAWDQNACLFEFSPVSAYIEDVVLGWLLEIFGLPPDCGGAFVTGTQMADLTALAAARHSVLSKIGWNVENDGMDKAPSVSIIVGEEVHATMIKALALLGFGKNTIHFVPADSQGRMKASAIPHCQGPVIICAQIGNVNTGSCDPISDICKKAKDMDAWVHIDGAFGLWAAASPKLAHLTNGIANADSWATDAHKWLNVPYDSGIAIVKDDEALKKAMNITGAYYPPERESTRQPMHLGPESSRRARAIEIWAAMRTLGKNGIADLIERTCEYASLFSEALRKHGYELLNEVTLNQVLVRFVNDEITTRVIEYVQSDGTCWCGGTLWKDKKAMRISVSSWATTELDVLHSIDAILTAAEQANSRVHI